MADFTREAIKNEIKNYVHKMWFTDNPVTEFENKLTSMIGMSKPYSDMDKDIEKNRGTLEKHSR